MLIHQKSELVLKLRMALTRAINNADIASSAKTALGVLIFSNDLGKLTRPPLLDSCKNRDQKDAITDLLDLLQDTLELKCPTSE